VGDGRLRVITGEVAPVVGTRDPRRFQAECVEAFVASWTARGFAESTIANDVGVLERMLVALGRPVWEVTAEDVDRVVGELATAGRAVSTRRNYLQVFKGFHRFLEVRKAAEIEAAFGVRLACPLDEFNAARHIGDDSPSAEAPPTPERVAAFFEFLKGRIATARKYAPAARDCSPLSQHFSACATEPRPPPWRHCRRRWDWATDCFGRHAIMSVVSMLALP
jgi:integrase/recombinase XerD